MAEENVVLRIRFEDASPVVQSNIRQALAAGASPSDIAAANLNVQRVGGQTARVELNDAIAEAKRKEQQAKDEIDFERNYNLNQSARAAEDVKAAEAREMARLEAQFRRRQRDQLGPQGTRDTLARFAPNPASAIQTLGRFGPSARPRASSRVPGRRRGGDGLGFLRAGAAAGAAGIAARLGLGGAGAAAAAAGAAGTVGALGPAAAIATPAIIALGAAASAATRQLAETEELGRVNADVAAALAQRDVTRVFGRLRRGQQVGEQIGDFALAREDVNQAILDFGATLNTQILPIASTMLRFVAEIVRNTTPSEEQAKAVVDVLKQLAELSLDINPIWAPLMKSPELRDWLKERAEEARRRAEEEATQRAKQIDDVFDFFTPGEFQVPEGAAGI